MPVGVSMHWHMCSSSNACVCKIEFVGTRKIQWTWLILLSVMHVVSYDNLLCPLTVCVLVRCSRVCNFPLHAQLCLLPGDSSNRVKERAQRVLFFLSGLHFHGIFNKIILRCVCAHACACAHVCVCVCVTPPPHPIE